MRSALVSLAMMLLLSSAASAQVERRIFIIANNADNSNAEWCLATGRKCGAKAADRYCALRTFKRALAYRKVARQEITGGVPVNGPECDNGRCDEFVAITCAR